MKKSKLQVVVEFMSLLTHLNAGKNKTSKNTTGKNSKKIGIAVCLILFFAGNLQATTYYSRANGDWSTSSSWSTSGYGNPVNLGTFPQAGDIVNIGDGYTIFINTNVSCTNINIGQGLSGTLEFLSTGNFTATVSGNITMNNGSRFRYNTAVNRTHLLNVGGNFTNYGNVDFRLTVAQAVNLAFINSTNSIVTGTGVWDLNIVILNKSGSTATSLNVQSPTFESAIRSFSGTYGTYIHNNTTSFSINPTTSTFTIGPNMIYRVPLGTMSFGSNTDIVTLQGQLFVNGGNVNIGSSAGMQGLRTDQNGALAPYLEVSSGTLTVFGGISNATTSPADPFSFKMSGGTLLLNSGTTGTGRELFWVTDVAGSVSNISGGTIILQKQTSGGTSVTDFGICSGNGSVISSGGIIQFGNTSTPSGTRFNFKPSGTAVLPHFFVSGPAAGTVTLATSNSSTANFSLLSLRISTGKIFDIRSIAGTTGDTKTMTLLSTVNGIDALQNDGTFMARQSTVTFNTSGAQAIGGANVTSFYNLSINNASNITLNKPSTVTNYLSMVNGKLMTTNTNVLSCSAAASASLGNSGSYVDGPMVHTVSSTSSITKTYPVGKGIAYRPVVLTVQHSNAFSVAYRAEVFNTPASSLPFSVPPSIANVSNVRYVRFLRQNISNFVSGRIQMYYNTDDGVADKNSLLVAHDDGVSMWQNSGGIATNNWVGSITSNTFTNFHNYFALANPPGGGNPLPVSLSLFKASLINDKVETQWITQAEINNDYFTVERSHDNINFTPLAVVDGSGTTSQTHVYDFTDPHPYKGVSYYRLKQTDFDGTTETYPVCVVNNENGGTFVVYPNPAVSAHVTLSADEALKYSTVIVQDLTGRLIPSTTRPQENGTMELEIDPAYAKPGSVFLINATDGSRSFRQKLFIQ
jgi:hypothetical protein